MAGRRATHAAVRSTLASSLLVRTSLDTQTVTLGPSRRLVARSGLLVVGGAVVLGWGAAAWPGPIVASVGSMAGALVGGGMRLRGWVTHEAPLEIERGRHQLLLRRVFRGRVLAARTVPLSVLERVDVDGDTLVLTLADRELRVVAGYRTPEELQSVAAWLQEGADREGGVERDRQLDDLLASRQ